MMFKIQFLSRCMPKNLITEVSLFFFWFPILIIGKLHFYYNEENSKNMVLSALMLSSSDFSHLLRHFISLLISPAESMTLLPVIQIESELSSSVYTHSPLFLIIIIIIKCIQC